MSRVAAAGSTACCSERSSASEPAISPATSATVSAVETSRHRLSTASDSASRRPAASGARPGCRGGSWCAGRRRPWGWPPTDARVHRPPAAGAGGATACARRGDRHDLPEGVAGARGEPAQPALAVEGVDEGVVAAARSRRPRRSGCRARRGGRPRRHRHPAASSATMRSISAETAWRRSDVEVAGLRLGGGEQVVDDRCAAAGRRSTIVRGRSLPRISAATKAGTHLAVAPAQRTVDAERRGTRARPIGASTSAAMSSAALGWRQPKSRPASSRGSRSAVRAAHRISAPPQTTVGTPGHGRHRPRQGVRPRREVAAR